MESPKVVTSPPEAPEEPPKEEASPEEARLTKTQILAVAIQGQEDLAAEVGKTRQDGTKRRGRPPGSKNKPKEGAVTLPDLTPDKRLEMTRRMIEGSFIMLSAGLGPHWRLPPEESDALARVWQPVMEYYNFTPGIGLLIYNASALTVGIVGPRIQATVQHKTGLWGKLSAWWARRREKAHKTKP